VVLVLPSNRTFRCPNCGSTNVVIQYYATRTYLSRYDMHGSLIEQDAGLLSDEKFDGIICNDCGEEYDDVNSLEIVEVD